MALVTQEALCLLDPRGLITGWNAAAERDFGHAAPQLLGQPLALLFPPGPVTAGKPEALLRAALAEGHVEEMGRLLGRDGRAVLAELRMRPLPGAAGEHLGFALALRRLAGSEGPAPALVAAEARYRALFEHAPIGIVHADADSRYIDANASACAMLGYPREELVGLHAADILAPAEHAGIGQAIDDTLVPGGHRRSWRFRRKDGTALTADVVALAMPDGTLLGLLHDRTDREEAWRYRDHLAAIVEGSSDAIVGEDLEGRVTSWNGAAEALFGYPAEEMLGAPVARLVPPGRVREDLLGIARLLRGERLEPIETQRMTRDGRLIDVSISTSPIPDHAGRLVGASRNVRDITLHKARERELDRLTRLYAALSQINQAIVWIKDRQSLFERICQVLVREGGFRMAWIGWEDAATKRLIPVAAEGDEGDYVAALDIYTDDRPQGRGPTGIAFRSGQTYICNDMLSDPATELWRAKRSVQGFGSSTAMPIRQEGQVRGVLNVYAEGTHVFHDKEVALLEEAATDLSFALDNLARDEARRAAEETLRNEKLFSDTIVESLPLVVYFYDHEGRFLRWNRNFERVTGYSSAEIARMRPLDFFPEDQRPLLEARIAEVFARGESSVEAPLLARDGALHPHLLTGRRVEFGGRPCLVGAGLDLSERERRHRAEAADRIKSAFLATMSHELRTPLNSIIGFTGILLQGLPGPLNAEQAKQLQMVRGSARHLLALVNDVLDISKIEAGQLQIAQDRIETAAVIRRVVAGIGPQAEAKGLALSVAGLEALGPMLGDERRFAQILLNLLSNAVKFTEAGEIRLEASEPPGLPPSLVVKVADTGIGILPEDLETLFQPFRQIESGLSRRSEGTGLGLAICRRLAALMGGEVSVESEWGQGSVFSLTLPLRRPAP